MLWWVWVKKHLPRPGWVIFLCLGWIWSGQVSHLWVWKISPKKHKFFNFLFRIIKFSSGRFKKYPGRRWGVPLFIAGQKFAWFGLVEGPSLLVRQVLHYFSTHSWLSNIIPNFIKSLIITHFLAASLLKLLLMNLFDNVSKNWHLSWKFLISKVDFNFFLLEASFCQFLAASHV